MKQKIGIFLGTFDPIHIGHVSNIVKVLNSGIVDRVCIVPAYQNPWKKNPPLALEERVKLCSLESHDLNVALFGKNCGKIFVSDVEKRIEGEEHYSYKVLEKLKEEFPLDELCLICGTDVSNSISEWVKGNWILSHFKVITIERGGYVDSVKEPCIDVSSTQIREMIKNDKCPLPYISKRVWEEIKEFSLYKI